MIDLIQHHKDKRLPLTCAMVDNIATITLGHFSIDTNSIDTDSISTNSIDVNNNTANADDLSNNINTQPKNDQPKKNISDNKQHSKTHSKIKPSYGLTVVCVDCPESQELNATYRQKNAPTNVLSFASDLPTAMIDKLGYRPLGDLVICIPVVLAEADEQQKSPQHHFTHLVVHGILHLLGYDHETCDNDAQQMEALEIAILKQLGIDNPYQDDESD